MRVFPLLILGLTYDACHFAIRNSVAPFNFSTHFSEFSENTLIYVTLTARMAMAKCGKRISCC
jgi:hypothetical protein